MFDAIAPVSTKKFILFELVQLRRMAGPDPKVRNPALTRHNIDAFATL